MRTSRRTRPVRIAVAALVALAASAVVMAQPAGAVGSCRSEADYTVCFTVTWVAPRTYAVHIGLDLAMSRWEAQRLVDTYGSGTVIAQVWGEDAITLGDRLFSVPLSWVAAGDEGLGAELDVNVMQSQINEDDAWYDRRDEVVALIGPAEHAAIYSNEIHAYF